MACQPTGAELQTLPLWTPKGQRRVNVVFADAGYWIALWSPRDRRHERAIALSNDLATSTILTTDLSSLKYLTASPAEVDIAERSWQD